MLGPSGSCEALCFIQQTPWPSVSEMHPHSSSPLLCFQCVAFHFQKNLSRSNTKITVPFPRRNKVVVDLLCAPRRDLQTFLTKGRLKAPSPWFALVQFDSWAKAPFPPKITSCGELMGPRPISTVPWHSPWACSFCINLSAKKLSLNHLLY